MDLDHSMDDRYVTIVDLKDDNVTDANRLIGVIGEEEQIATLEGRLHAAGQNDDNR